MEKIKSPKKEKKEKKKKVVVGDDGDPPKKEKDKEKKTKKKKDEEGGDDVAKEDKKKKKEKKPKEGADGEKKKKKKKPKDGEGADGEKKKKKKKKTPKDGEEKEKDKKKKKKGADGKKKKKKGKKKGDAKPGVCCVCHDEEEKDLIGGLCPHGFSRACAEKILTRPLPDPQPTDAHLAAPTLGRCPECGKELRLFDMIDIKTGELAYERLTDIRETPLSGLVYVQDAPQENIGSFHFEEDSLKDEKGNPMPYVNLEALIIKDRDSWLLEDGSVAPGRKFFEPGYHYHPKTRTFHGTIKWDLNRFQGSYQWDMVLGFSKDFSSIACGVSIERLDRVYDGLHKVDLKDEHRYKYPLDGTWKLQWKKEDGSTQDGSVQVYRNAFQQGPYTFYLDFADPSMAHFRWPLDPIFAKSKSGVNLGKKPKGPEIGEKVVWETTHPAFPEIVWERQTIGDNPIPRILHFGPHSENSYKRLTEEGEDAAVKTADGEESDEDDDGWTDEDEDSESGESDDDDDEDSDGDDSESGSESESE